MKQGLQRAIAVGWGLLSLFAASLYLFDVYTLGFPDGHFTPYAEQTYTLRHVLVMVCAIQGLYFLLIGIFGKRTTIFSLCLQIIVAAIFIVAPMVIVPNCSQLPVCVQVYELIMNTSMDDGAGG